MNIKYYFLLVIAFLFFQKAKKKSKIVFDKKGGSFEFPNQNGDFNDNEQTENFDFGEPIDTKPINPFDSVIGFGEPIQNNDVFQPIENFDFENNFPSPKFGEPLNTDFNPFIENVLKPDSRPIVKPLFDFDPRPIDLNFIKPLDLDSRPIDLDFRPTTFDEKYSIKTPQILKKSKSYTSKF
jgi:hypothetical protein